MTRRSAAGPVSRRLLLQGAATTFIAGIASHRHGSAEERLWVIAPPGDAGHAVLAAAQAWSDETGEAIAVRLVPSEEMVARLAGAADDKWPLLDAAIVPLDRIGDLVNSDVLMPLDLAPGDEFGPVAALRSLGGVTFASPVGGAAVLLAGDAATISGPGQPNWDDLADRGRVALPTGYGGALVDAFVAFAGPHVLHDLDATQFWFDPDTLEPTLESDGFRAALERYRDLVTGQPTGWTGADTWGAITSGAAVAGLVYADLLPAIDADPGLAVVAAPGGSGADGALAPAGNVQGRCWGGVVTADGPNPDRAAAFLAWLGAPGRLDGMPGIVPSRPAASPDGTPVPESPGQQALAENAARSLQVPVLRIPGVTEYRESLSAGLARALAEGGPTPVEALAAIGAEWRDITIRYGIERQQAFYRQSVGLERRD